MTGFTAYPTRRAALALIAAAGASRSARAAGMRVATVDWSVLETLLALGLPPVAAPELRQFREIAVEPAVPETVADLGLRGTVNFELLLLSRPDLILSSSFYIGSEPRLRRIAPVESFSVYAPGVRARAGLPHVYGRVGSAGHVFASTTRVAPALSSLDQYGPARHSCPASHKGIGQ